MWKWGTKVEKTKEDKAQNAYQQLMATGLPSANRVFCRRALTLPTPCSWMCCTYVAWGFPTPSPSLLQHVSGLHTLIYRICSSVWVQDSDITRNTQHKVRIWRAVLCPSTVQPICGIPHGYPRGGPLRLHRAQPQIHSAPTTGGSLHGGEALRLISALRDDEVHNFKSTSLKVKCFS